MRNGFDRIAGIARITIADTLQQKSFIGLFLLCGFFVFLVRGCWSTRFSVNGQAVSGGDFSVQILKVVFVIVAAAAMLIAGLLAMRAFRQDRDEGMQAFILSKPVSRSQYLIGKILGLWLLMSAFMFALHGAVLVIHYLHSGAVGSGYLAASAMSALNVLFVILGVSLLSLFVPEIFAFLAVFGVTAGAFVFDGIAAAARSDAVRSMLSQSTSLDGVTWWKVVYWAWPKAGALESAAAAFIGASAAPVAGDVLVPLASVCAYCLVLAAFILLRFRRAEIV